MLTDKEKEAWVWLMQWVKFSRRREILHVNHPLQQSNKEISDAPQPSYD